MRFKGTFVLLMISLALGAFIYFYEIKGGEQRQKAKESENRLWSIEEKDIQQIEIFYSGERVTATRKDDKEWVLTSPKTLDADSEELDRLARSLATLQRESVVEDNAQDLMKFGLNPAQTRLKFRTKNGKNYAIDFGSNNPTGSHTYALIPGQSSVFLVSSGGVASFNKKADDLRNHSVLSFEQSAVQSLQIKNSKGAFELFKDKDDRWWFKGFENRAADGPNVRGILIALSLGRVKEFFNEAPEDYETLGFEKPLIDVILTYGKDKALKQFLVGLEKSKLKKKRGSTTIQSKQDAQTGLSDGYLAKDASRPDIFIVEKDLVDKLLKSPDDVRDRALVSIQRWDVDSIELKNTKGQFNFVKLNGEWFLGAEKKKAKWDAVSAILDAMEKPVKHWIDRPGPYRQYGLDNPPIHIVFKQGGTTLAECALGGSHKDGVYASVKGDPCVKVADPDGLAGLDRGENDFIEGRSADDKAKK